MNKKVKGNLMLLLTSIIWGSAFVAQVKGMDHVGPFTFNSVRNFVAGLALLIVIALFGKKLSPDNTAEHPQTTVHNDRSTLIKGGIYCGMILFVASFFQQSGVQYTTAGKAGFITTLYIVIVPILGLFIGKKVDKKIWICVLIAASGLYLLSIKGDFDISKGDALIFVCAIFFSFHILVIDHFSPKVDGIKMSCIQFFVCGSLNTISMVFFESPTVSNIMMASVPILYAGLLSSGVGYTLQIIGQKDTDPTIASLILSLESVFAVLAGAVILGEVLTSREKIGCILIFVAIIIAQIPGKMLKKEPDSSF